jgi:hypothetical protein
MFSGSAESDDDDDGVVPSRVTPITPVAPTTPHIVEGSIERPVEADGATTSDPK